MINTVLVKNYKEPEFDFKEIYRYCGCGTENEDMLSVVKECIDECRGRLSYKVCYRQFPIKHTEDGVDLSFARTGSRDLQKNLADCESIILFSATIGIEIDRLIAKYGRISPSKALVFQSIGAERIESLCNAFNDDIKTEFAKSNLFTRPRFSPGYGDLPIELQKDVFRVLDCPRKIGLTLNDSMLMSPSKSVTAIIGITECGTTVDKNKCLLCKKSNCAFRSVDK